MKSGIPFGLSARAGDQTVTLTWPSTAGAQTYNLYWAEGGQTNKLMGVPLTNVTSPYVHEGRQNGHTYSYVVTSVNLGLLESDDSNRVTVTPKQPPPGSPKVEIIPGYERLTLWWQPVANASSYVGYISEDPGVPIANGRPVSLPPLVYENLQVGKPYYFVVAAINAAGEATESLELSGSPSASPLSPPSFIQVSNTDGANQFKWNAVEQATVYRIYWGIKPQVNQGNKYFTVNGLTYLHENLTSGTRYYYRISAKNDFIESPLSHEMSIIARANPPQGPTGLTAKAGNGSVELDWNPMTNAGSYNLYYDRNGVKNAIPNVTPPYVHDSLEKTAYTYEVTAIIDGVESEASYAASAIPLFPPAAPTELVVDAGEAVNGISWKASPGAIGYNIYWIADEPVTQDNGTLIGSVSSPYFHSGLDPSKTYHYRVSAVNGDGESELSGEMPGKPLAPPPPKVDLVVTAADINLSAGATVNHGQTVTITYTVANLGNKSTAEESPWARGFYVGFDLTQVLEPNMFGALGIQSYEQFEWVGDLVPGKSGYIGTFEFVIPNQKPMWSWRRLYSPGTYFVKVHADAWNNQLEGNENNNQLIIQSKPLTVAANDGEDLSITAIQGVPASAAQGTRLELTTTVVNTGTAPAYKNWLKYYLVDSASLPVNLDTAIKIGDSRIDLVTTQVDVPAQPYIPLNAKTTVTYYLAALVDGDNEQVEANENNNWFVSPQAMTITADQTGLTGPNIVVSATTAQPPQPQYEFSGEPVAIDISVSNQGDLPFVDQNRNSDLGTRVTLEPVAADPNGDPNYPNTLVFFSAPQLQPGDPAYQIQTWLYNGNPYIDYFNNRFQRLFQWPQTGTVTHRFGHNRRVTGTLDLNMVANNDKDFVISAAAIEKTTGLQVGERVNVSFTVSNIGTADAGGFFVYMYVANYVPGWIADVWIPKLQAGDSTSRLINVSLPAAPAGPQNLYVVADYISNNESNEANNVRIIPVEFTGQVEFGMTNLTLDASSELFAGGLVSGSVDFINNGTSPVYCCELTDIEVVTTQEAEQKAYWRPNLNKLISHDMVGVGETQKSYFKIRLPYFLRAQPHTLRITTSAIPGLDVNPANNTIETALDPISTMDVAADGVVILPNNIPGDIRQDSVMQGTVPYVITKNIKVHFGAMLKIKAGTVLKFANGIELKVHGGLLVQGVQGNPVTFTSNVATPADVAPGQWKGLRVLRPDGFGNWYPSNLMMEYAIIEGAETGLELDAGEVNFTRIRNNTIGLHFIGISNPTLSNSDISNNGTGMLVTGLINYQRATGHPVPRVNNNNIVNTRNLETVNFPLASAPDFNFTGNWWGSDQVPTIEAGFLFNDVVPTVNLDPVAAGPYNIVF